MKKNVTTAITKVEPQCIRVYGYDLSELIGAISFGEMVFLLLSGELPQGQEGRMIEAILVSSADHGLEAPSTHVARTAASCGVPLQSAIAAGVSVIGESHGGAGEACARLLQEALAASQPGELGALARQIVAGFRERRERVPGFGHRQHVVDPRTQRLLQLAAALQLSARHVALALALQAELAQQSGQALSLNVDGAIAAILSDMGLHWRHARSLFIIARTAGLAAQVQEQMRTGRPLGFAAPVAAEYIGPEARSFYPPPQAPEK